MAGEQAHAARDPAMGQRDAGRRGAAGRGGDPGHDRERHAVAGEMRRLLAAPAEDEGIAALQSDDCPPRAREADEKAVDVRLRHVMIAGNLAGKNARRARRNERKNGVGDQLVINDDIRLAEQTQRLDCHEIRIPRPGADNVYAAHGVAHVTCSLRR